jgi:hypothetical protein
LLLYSKEYGSFKSDLSAHLGPIKPAWRQSRAEETALSTVGELVRVLQSLRFYQECYGESCITFPDEQPSTSRSLLADNTVRTPMGAVSKCSLTLFWEKPDSLPPVLPALLGGTSSLFSHALSEGELTIRETLPNGIEPSTLSRLAFSLQKDSGNVLTAPAIAKILTLAEDLSRCLHESRPRSFTFLLGSPQWLISDLQIEHELVGAARSFRLAARTEEPDIYQSTRALLEGNSSFLQADDMCLFVAWPGEPLEVTHIVKVPRLDMIRKKLLCSFTADRPGLLAVVTHGNGRGEVIFEGRVRGVLRGHSWEERPPENVEFEARLRRELVSLVGKRKAGELVAVLQPVIQDLSEAPGVGALFIISKRENINTLLKASSKLTDVLDSVDGQRLVEMPSEVLFQLAQDDGATLICCDSLCVWGRRHLQAPVLPNLEPQWKEEGSKMHWRHWYKTKSWGTRRRTGLAVSYDLREAGIVITISADGPVDLLLGGHGVAAFSE